MLILAVIYIRHRYYTQIPLVKCTIKLLFSGIRISVIAHGDYCDEGTSYVVKWIDFGATLPEVCDFVSNAGRTGGGDGPECYELVMQRAREVLSWTPGSQRALILIGDNLPHEPGYSYGGKQYFIDWRVECEELRKMVKFFF